MPFIGKPPAVGAYSVLDALTASATANYSLQLNGAAFVPNSVNQLLVSLNGVIQKPGSSFVVSGIYDTKLRIIRISRKNIIMY